MSGKNPARNYAAEYLGKGGLTEQQAASVAAVVVAATTPGDATGTVYGDVIGALLGPLLVQSIHGGEASVVLAGAANDYDLGTSRRDAFYWLIDFAGFDVSGFAAPDSPGEVHVVVNTGTAGHILASSALSAAANRVVSSGGDVAMATDAAVLLAYSATLARWVAVGSSGAAGAAGRMGPPGLDGRDGEDGISLPGPAGTPGTPGADSIIPGPQGPQGWAGEDGADSYVPGPKGDPGNVTRQAHGTVGATEDISWATDIHRLTLGAATCTLSPVNLPASGTPVIIKIFFTQDASGGRLVSWWSGILWKAGTPPTLATAAGAIDQVDLYTDDGGASYIGTVTSVIIGAQGAQGNAGQPGYDGPAGEDSNVPGPQGSPGLTGAQGVQGIPGPLVFEGEPGEPGYQPGPPGNVGATGATGPLGVTAKATASGTITTTAALQDVTGASVSLAAGTYAVVATFYAKVNNVLNDRTFEGHLDVNGVDQTDIASVVFGTLANDIIECTQTWLVTLSGTQTIKLRTKHSGGTTGDFTTQTTCVLLAVQGGGSSVNTLTAKGTWAGPQPSTAIGTTWNTDRVVAIRVVVPFAFTPTHMGIGIQTSSGSQDIGIYADDGTGQGPTGAPLCSTGKFASPGTGRRTRAITTPVSIGPGVYWLATIQDNATQQSHYTPPGTGVGGSGGLACLQANGVSTPAGTLPNPWPAASALGFGPAIWAEIQ